MTRARSTSCRRCVSLPDQVIDGTVYNLRPAGAEPARLGLKLQPFALPPPLPQALPPVYLEAPVYLRPGAGRHRARVRVRRPAARAVGPQHPDHERAPDASSGKASRGHVHADADLVRDRRPRSARVNSYEAPATFSREDVRVHARRAAPRSASPRRRRDRSARRARPRRAACRRCRRRCASIPEQAALEDRRGDAADRRSAAEPGGAAAAPACARRRTPTACPASSRVGTAIIDSPLQARAGGGPGLPGLQQRRVAAGADRGAAAAGGPARRRPDRGAPPIGLRNIVRRRTPTCRCGASRCAFAGGAERPIRAVEGPVRAEGADGDRGRSSPPTRASVREFKQELATPGCDPIATR